LQHLRQLNIDTSTAATNNDYSSEARHTGISATSTTNENNNTNINDTPNNNIFHFGRSRCANCGKAEESKGDLKTCIACKSVKYCNSSCQKSHRKQHKNECRKRAAELFDEALFNKPPPAEECPICLQMLPVLSETMYQSCCGKTLCMGCVVSYESTKGKETLCPFCRKQCHISPEEKIRQCKERMEVGDAKAFAQLGSSYLVGDLGLPQNTEKGLELMLRGAELGSSNAHINIATFYTDGLYAQVDYKKALHHWQQAAMLGGDNRARFNLGLLEAKSGNVERAMKHWIIAAGTGDKDALDNIRRDYMRGFATKDQYTTALRDYQAYKEDVKSDQRDRALESVYFDRVRRFNSISPYTNNT